MASSTATRRASRRASVADVEISAGGGSSKLRIVVILLLLGIVAGSIAAALLQPAELTERLTPAWTYAGPWLIVGPVLLVATYIALRVFGLKNARVWRWAGAMLLGAGAAQTALHYFEVTEIQGISIESSLSGFLADFTDLQVIGIFAGLTLVTLILLSPIGAFRAARASGRAGHAASVAGASAAAAGGAAAKRRVQEVRAARTYASDEEGTSEFDEAPIPRTRIVVPEPARAVGRPRYPEPVGVVRDQQKRVQQEIESARGGETTQEQRPRIVMPGVPSNRDVEDATKPLAERHFDSAETGTIEGPTNLENPTAVEEKPLFIPPPGLSSVDDQRAHHSLHPDVEGEGFGMNPDEVDEMGQRDPLAFTDHDADDEDDAWDIDKHIETLIDGTTDEPIEDMDDVDDLDSGRDGPVLAVGEFEPAEDSIELAEEEEPIVEDDELTEREAPGMEEDKEGVAAVSRSDQALLDSLDPFAGLPKVAWKFPSFKLFDEQPAAEVDTESHLETAEAIQETLQEYGIEVEVTEVRPGPTVTLYGVRPGWDRRYRTVRERNEDGQIVAKRQEVGRTRVKVDAISKLDDDLALQLKAASVRIEPIQGTNLVGVEVPNATAETVFMRPQMESDAYRKARGKSMLAFPLGKGSGGEPVVADLARMPHLLVAGSTGSGKSVFINSLITSLISRATPDDLRFVMIDPKRVELTIYNGIPHLITPVIVDTQKVVNALQWMMQQMENRLEMLAQQGARDIASYNEKVGERNRMPYLVLIVDELADLMMTSGKAVETGLVRLAQMGRATGIHLVVATQRPSVNVITGLIKANFPTRISFMVTSLVDSRTILDGAGAEKLLGRGDMLYLPQDASRPLRIQSAFISSHESDAFVDAWRAQSKGYVPPELPDLVQPEDIGLQSRGRNGSTDDMNGNGSKRNGSGEDDIMEQARELADIYKGKVSTSLLQRRLGIGYPRAARLRDRLVEEGLAGAEIPNAPAETAGRGIRRTREAAAAVEEEGGEE